MPTSTLPPPIWGHYFDSRGEILTFTYPSQNHALQKLTLSSQKVIIHLPPKNRTEPLPAVGRRSVHLARPGPCQMIVIPSKWDLNVFRFNGFSNICKIVILQLGKKSSRAFCCQRSFLSIFHWRCCTNKKALTPRLLRALSDAIVLWRGRR